MPDNVGYIIRELRPTDLPAMRDLMAAFAEAFEDREIYQGAPPSDAYLTRLLAKEHFIVVTAARDGAIVGGLVAYQLDKFEQDRREIYIYDLAVVESHRRRGVATGLIEHLRKIAAERDVYVIFVQADLVDAPAIALYDSLGTRETAHHFDIEVKMGTHTIRGDDG